MNQPEDPTVKYEHDPKPIAIQHQGMFVYANPAFLQLTGYSSFEDLEAMPVLDLVVDRHRERLIQHFSEAENCPKSAKTYPRAKLTLLKSNGLKQVVLMDSCHTRYEGEETVEFTLLTEDDFSVKNRLKRLPWKLYVSVLMIILLTALPNAILLNLNINNAPKVYLPEDAPSVIIDQTLREVFPNDQAILLLFEGVALYSDGFLKALNQLSERLEANPLVDDVISATNQDHIRGAEDGFLVEPLLDVNDLDALHPRDRRVKAMTDRFSRRLIVAGDGSALSMIIIPVGADNSLERMALQNSVLEEVDRANLTGYLTGMAGQVTTDVAQMHSMLRDNMVFIPGTTIVGLFLVWWLFRRLLPVLVTGVVIGAVVNSTVAFYVLFDQPFNLISSIIPPLLAALSVAALVHLYNALHYASKRGLTGPDRVASAMKEIQRPALYTALTTAAGLSSLGLSPIPPIKVFGLVSAVGVVLIYIVVIHLVPSIFSKFDYAPWPSRGSGLGGLDKMVGVLLTTGLRYPVHVIATISLLLAVSAPQIGNVIVETNLQEFFYADHKVRQDVDYIEGKLVGTTSLDVVLTSDGSEDLTSPQILKEVRAFQQWVEKELEVDKSTSYADFVEEMHWGFHSEDPGYRQIPDNAELIKQYLLVYDGDGLYDFVDEAFTVAHINLHVNVHGANDISLLMEKIRDYFAKNSLPGATVDIAGAGRLFADQEDLLVEGQVNSLAGALGLIFILMLIQWRSLGSALLCMIPNLSPIILIFIIMGVLGIWLDMATAMIASVAVGIAVDDTIHVYHGFLHRMRNGVHPVAAIVRTYRQAGRAVMTTTIILSAQFLVLTTSQFIPTTNFGLLTSVGLVAALVFDLLLLPAILLLIYGRKSRRVSNLIPD